MSKSTFVGCGALIYSMATDRYLFLLRSSGRYANTWALPGGKLERNENTITALNREMLEEMQFVNSGRTIPIEQFTNNDGKFIYHTFLIPVADEFVPKLNHEHKGYCWVHIRDHPKPLHPGVWRTINFEVIISKIKTLESLVKNQS